MDRDNQVIGANPHFTGEARFRATVTAPVASPDESPLDGAFQAGAAAEDDDPETGCCRFVFDCSEPLWRRAR